MHRLFWLISLACFLSSCISYKYRYPKYGSFDQEKISEYHNKPIRTIETNIINPNRPLVHEGILIAYTDSTLTLAQKEDSAEVFIKYIIYLQADFLEDTVRKMMEIKDHIKIVRRTIPSDSKKRKIKGRIQEIGEMGIVVKCGQKSIHENFDNMKRVKFKIDVIGTVVSNASGTMILMALSYGDWGVGGGFGFNPMDGY